MSENKIQPIPKPKDPIDPGKNPEKNISDWKKIWEVFGTSIIGKITLQEIIKMAIEKVLLWAIEDFSE